MNTELTSKIKKLASFKFWGTSKNDSSDIDSTTFDSDFNTADDLPLTLVKEQEPGIRYYTTENSPMAVGAEKVEAGGIDKFGDEDDTLEFDEADDFQTNRDRKQNSDLSQRFYSPGLDLD